MIDMQAEPWKPVTKFGAPCPRCGQSIRYVSNSKCLTCKRLQDRAERGKGCPADEDMRPDAVTRPTGWLYRENEHGERVEIDPIEHLGLGDEGAYE